MLLMIDREYMTKTIQTLGQHWSHRTRDKDNPDTGTKLVTQDTEQRQSRHWDNIGHTRHGTNKH